MSESRQAEDRAGTPMLQVEGLTTVFHMKRRSLRVLRNVSFSVHTGESFGLIGESGSGKSVTCLSILRCLPPNGTIVGGRILWNGENLLEKSEGEMRRIRGREIAYVPQDPTASLNPVLTIGLQIDETMAAHMGSPPLTAVRRRTRALELLEAVGIPSAQDRLRAYPHELSGGLKQRSIVAIALSTTPRLVVADEPTSNLDATTQAQLLALLRRLRTQMSIATIFVTHDFSVVSQMCENVGVMYAGSMMETAATQTLLTGAAHPYTRALLACIPSMDEKQGRLPAIEGQVPDISTLGPGCPFANRCEWRMPTCDEAHPPTVRLREGHEVACWKYV